MQDDPFRIRSRAKWPQVLVIAFLGGVGLYAVGRTVGKGLRPAAPEAASIPNADSAATSAAAARTAPAAPRSPTRAAAAAPDAVKRFQDKFGADLRLELSREGRLESARGTPGSGSRATPDFRPDDPQKAITRAREVLAAAREALGVEDDLPLGMPIAKGSATSAQVFFRETSDGVPLAPLGHVTVDLGPQGELLGLHSDYAPGIRVTNARTHTADELLKKAATAVPDVSTSIKPSGGSPVIWVAQASGGGVEGRHAYEYQVQGHQVVVDASSGEILRKRDQRDF